MTTDHATQMRLFDAPLPYDLDALAAWYPELAVERRAHPLSGETEIRLTTSRARPTTGAHPVLARIAAGEQPPADVLRAPSTGTFVDGRQRSWVGGLSPRDVPASIAVFRETSIGIACARLERECGINGHAARVYDGLHSPLPTVYRATRRPLPWQRWIPASADAAIRTVYVTAGGEVRIDRAVAAPWWAGLPFTRGALNAFLRRRRGYHRPGVDPA